MTYTRTTLALLLCLVCFFGTAQASNITLIYHHIGAGRGGTLGVSAAQLRQRVATLRALGYTFITSSQIRQYPPHVKTAVLEFDDGFDSVYTTALPLLKALGVPGSAYPIIHFIGAPGYMTQAQLSELRAAGWDVGSHTRNHADLSEQSPSGLRRELDPAGLTGAASRCVAYPFSLSDARVRRAAAERYPCAVSGHPGTTGEDYDLPGPQITPWDDRLLPYRAPLGLDARTPMLGAGLGVLAYDAWQTAQASDAASGAPRFWHPAQYELLGRGEYRLTLSSEQGRLSSFSQRQGRAVFSAISRVGPQPYAALSAAYRWPGVTLGAGYSSGGILLGAAVSLNGYGEGWWRYQASSWALGAELIPADYWRLQAEYDSRSGYAAQLRYALPLNTGEGRPYRALLGFDQRAGWYAGGSWRIGSYALNATAGLSKPSFGLGFQSRW